MAKKEISHSQREMWQVIANLSDRLKDYESLIRRTEAELKSFKAFYKQQYGQEFDLDDNLLLGSKYEEETVKENIATKTQEIKITYDVDWKVKDKILWAIDQLGGSAGVPEISGHLKRMEKNLNERSITQNVYSMIQRGFLSRPDGYGGQVSIQKRNISNKTKTKANKPTK